MRGKACFIQIDPSLIIANFYTQKKYGYDGKQYAIHEAIESGMRDVLEYNHLWGFPIYMPMIGCGLGGLSWDNDVEPIISKLSEQYPHVKIYVCDI